MVLRCTSRPSPPRSGHWVGRRCGRSCERARRPRPLRARRNSGLALRDLAGSDSARSTAKATVWRRMHSDASSTNFAPMSYIFTPSPALFPRFWPIGQCGAARLLFSITIRQPQAAHAAHFSGGGTKFDGKLGGVGASPCAACRLHANGLPRPLASLVASLPPAVGSAVERASISGGLWTALRIPELTRLRIRAFQSLMEKSDRVVALCHWTRDLLRRNGVPEHKITVCRTVFRGLRKSLTRASYSGSRDCPCALLFSADPILSKALVSSSRG